MTISPKQLQKRATRCTGISVIAQNPTEDELESEIGDAQDISGTVLNGRIARRVAHALAVLSFGPEFVLN